MRKILALLALTLAASTTSANEATIKLFCEKSSYIDSVLKQHKEQLLFVGLDDMHKIEGLTASLFYNEKTKTYSILFLAPNVDMVCVVSSGTLGKIIYKQ
jgi:hypothetical protein